MLPECFCVVASHTLMHQVVLASTHFGMMLGFKNLPANQVHDWVLLNSEADLLGGVTCNRGNFRTAHFYHNLGFYTTIAALWTN